MYLQAQKVVTLDKQKEASSAVVSQHESELACQPDPKRLRLIIMFFLFLVKFMSISPLLPLICPLQS